VAVKLAEVEPSGIVSEAGRVSAELLEVSVTEAPPDGAGPFRMTLHVVESPGARLDGLHASEVVSTAGAVTGGVNVTFAVRELPFKVAVTVAF
jgi:hypothetical protein